MIRILRSAAFIVPMNLEILGRPIGHSSWSGPTLLR